MRECSAGARFLEILNRVAPDYSPETYGDREPLKHNFVRDGLERALQCWGTGFLWKRTKPKVTGNAIVGFQRAHDKINLRMALKVLDVDVVQQLFMSIAQSFGIVLAYIHVRTTMDLADPNHYRRHLMPFQSLTTHDLREGIPDFPWAIVFGEPYVQLFGKERLLRTPSAQLTDLGNAVYIQLTENPSDVVSQRSTYSSAQLAAKEHLNAPAFRGDGAVVVPPFTMDREQ